MRREYSGALTEDDVTVGWPELFSAWLAAAVAADLPEPNAMVLATADGQGRPSARTVLLKGYDERGFVFYTNYNSRKGVELAANPHASLVFLWLPVSRQVRVEGTCSPVSRAETEAYFALRPRGSQLGAWASPQSAVVGSRAELDEAARAVEERFAETPDVPPPPHWGGYRVRPDTVEFWQGRQDRMHDRIRYSRAADEWKVERLAP
ncbi:pyridoxamine 5'-phosphate oxidase [Virgisporangium aurantiacum]|nr:pyridoxamine 5'-phosphate oxidase [Virgisporangium aurantiacum]